MLYLSVKGITTSSFSLLGTIDDQESRAIPLSDGALQVVSLPHSGSYARFTFFADQSFESFVIEVVGLHGDPNLYVNTNASNGDPWPSTTAYDLTSNTLNGETLVIRPGHTPLMNPMKQGQVACRNCEYRLAVYAWAAETEFFISVTSDRSVRLLSDGLPAIGEANTGPIPQSLTYFRYFVRTDIHPIDIVLTPLSGNPSLFARFGCKPYALDNCNSSSVAGSQRPPGWRGDTTETMVYHTYSSTQDDGIEQIHLMPNGDADGGGEMGFCSPPCTLFIAVQAVTDSSFSILVTQRPTSLITITDGVPQNGWAYGDDLHYYTVHMRSWAASHGLLVSLSALLGQPIVYWSNITGHFPTKDDYSLTGTPDEPLRLPAIAANIEASYIFAIGSSDNLPARYSVTAQSGESAAVLVDGHPFSGEVLTGTVALYVITVPSDVPSPAVYVTALQGTIRLLVAIDEVAPGGRHQIPIESQATYSTTAAMRHPAVLPLTPGQANVISVTHLHASTDSTRRASFTLLPVLRRSEAALLLDGYPQALYLSGCQAYLGCQPPTALRFVAHGDHAISLSASIVQSAGGLGSTGGNMPTLTLYASTQDTEPSRCTSGHCFVATANHPGEAVRLSFPSNTLNCGEECTIHIELASTLPANVTITAATESVATQLQVGVPACADVEDGQLNQYAVLLDPDDTADDRLTLQLHLCSGKAELFAEIMRSPTESRHEFTSTHPSLMPVHLPTDRLAGRSKIYAAVHGLSEGASQAAAAAARLSSFCLEARPAGEPPREVTLIGDQGTIALLDVNNYGGGGGLAVGLAPLQATDLGLHETDSHVRVQHMPGVQYELWAGELTDNAVLSTWCGVEQSGAMQLHITPSADLTLGVTSDESSAITAMMRVRKAQLHRIDHAKYLLTIVAKVQVQGQPLRRFVYQPIEWTVDDEPEVNEEGEGANGGLIAFLVLLVLFCGACGACAYIKREKIRPRVREGMRTLRSNGLPVSSLLPRRRGRRTAGGTRTVDVNGLSGEAMDAPLTLNSYQAPVVVNEPLQLPAPPTATMTTVSDPPTTPPLNADAINGGDPATTRDTSDPKYNARLERARSAKKSGGKRPSAATPSVEFESEMHAL